MTPILCTHCTLIILDNGKPPALQELEINDKLEKLKAAVIYNGSSLCIPHWKAVRGY